MGLRVMGLVVGWLGVVVAVVEAGGRPNFVVIMADDLGYGDLGCYGGEVATPHLDRLAAEGMRFVDFHSSGNVCSPTRAGLLTGRYQQRAGIPGVVNADPGVAAHWHGLQAGEVTFAEVLRGAGYATGLFGKWHVGYAAKYNPVHQGFGEFRGFVSGNIDYHSKYDRMGVYDWWDGLERVEEAGYVTDLITEHAVGFIEANRGRPFCCYVAHEAVHSPWQGRGDAVQRGPEAVPGAAGAVDQPRAFRDMLVALDEGVGRVVAAIDAAGLKEKTLVWFFSDNGPAGGSAGPLRGRKGSDWEGGHRVPAIVRWPGVVEAGSESAVLGITLDVMPTMLSLAGTGTDGVPALDGVDLSGVMRGEDGAAEGLRGRDLFWNGRAMRDGKWKLMVGGRGVPRGEVGLYNLDADLGETENVASAYPERVAAMRAALAAWEAEVAAGATVQPGRGL